MLTLIVPGLILPSQALADLTQGLDLPALARCLGRGRRQRRAPATVDALLARAFSLPSPLPAAALRDPEGAQNSLCLDPVHLRFEERTLIVEDPAVLGLDADEAAQLAVSLAPTFAALGTLHVLTPSGWNLRLREAPPGFEPLPEARLRRADPLPLGPAHAAWRAALNEAQMVLHAHPVNRAREAAGRPVVNSLWPWGGGVLPLPPATPCAHDAIWSDDPALQGIGRHRGIAAGPLPAGLPAHLGQSPLALFDALDLPARSGNGLAWREGIDRLDRLWLAPALAAIREGRLDGLHLIAPGTQGNEDVLLRKTDLWKFWRRPAPATTLAP